VHILCTKWMVNFKETMNILGHLRGNNSGHFHDQKQKSMQILWFFKFPKVNIAQFCVPSSFNIANSPQYCRLSHWRQMNVGWKRWDAIKILFEMIYNKTGPRSNSSQILFFKSSFRGQTFAWRWGWRAKARRKR